MVYEAFKDALLWFVSALGVIAVLLGIAKLGSWFTYHRISGREARDYAKSRIDNIRQEIDSLKSRLPKQPGKTTNKRKN